MKSLLATIFYHRSLTFAWVALFFGIAAFARIFNFTGLAQQQGREFVNHSMILCIISFIVCIAVLANLVLDVKRGYKPNRCSLASVIMLGAFAGPVLLAFTLATYFSVGRTIDF